MLAKWRWRGKTEQGKLWYGILKCKYGKQFQNEPTATYNKISPIMKSITQIQAEQQLKIFGTNDFTWILGNGKVVKFWNDIWWEDKLISSKFKRLYLHVAHKNITISEIVTSYSNNTMQRLWRHNLRGWETHEQHQLKLFLHNISLQPYQDKVIWNKGKNIYTPGRGYKIMKETITNNSQWLIL